MGNFCGPKIILDGLLLHLDAANLKSYVGSGSTWADLTKNNRNATLFNNAIFNSANYGTIDFNRTNDSYATIPHDEIISNQVFGSSTNFTLSAWFNVREYVNYSCFLQKASSGSYSNTTCGLWSEAEGSNRLRLVIGSNVGSNPAGSTFSITYTATPNQWYHMVGIGDGTNAKLYINGQLIGSTLFSSITTERTENLSSITIGRRSMIDTPELDALIGMLSVYNRGLTQEEIQQNFNATRNRYGI